MTGRFRKLMTLVALACPGMAAAGPFPGVPAGVPGDSAEALPDLPPIPDPLAARAAANRGVAPAGAAGRPGKTPGPEELGGLAAAEPAGATPAMKADAGDDVLALVGRQVTLNGVRSQPRGRIGYRWIQTGGPAIRLKLEDGYVFTFVPVEPGVYRFALVVAAGMAISEPDAVTVTVGSPSAPSPGAAAEAPAQPEATEPVDEAACAAILRVPGGPEAAGVLAVAFDGVAERLDLYRSYAELYQELARRVGPVMPAAAAPRLAWEERVFAPLTARLIALMAAEGLDLRSAAGQQAPLTPPQRSRLREQFRSMAAGFRLALPGR